MKPAGPSPPCNPLPSISMFHAYHGHPTRSAPDSSVASAYRAEAPLCYSSADQSSSKDTTVRLLLRLVTALLLGSFIGFSTTCGSLNFGGRAHPLAADHSSTGLEASAPQPAVAPTAG